MKRSVHPEGRGRREAAGESNVIAEFDASPTIPAAQSLRLAISYAWGLDLSGTTTGAGGVGGLLFTKLHSAPGAPVLAPCYDGTQGDWRESRETNRRFARQGETSARRERVNCSGNILAYVDCAAGQALARYEYDPFGKLLLKDDDTRVAGRLHHQFSTKYADEETGLAYYGYRYYAPELGRWVNRDPIGEEGGLNLYGICRDDVVNQWDVNGTFWTLCWDAIQRSSERRQSESFTDKQLHCITSCELMKECGQTMAKALGAVKELRDLFMGSWKVSHNALTGSCALGIPTIFDLAHSITGHGMGEAANDMTANITGYACAVDDDCEKACERYYH